MLTCFLAAVGSDSSSRDVNAPDLYIPVMAFISYVLLVALTYGIDKKFSPELLISTATRGIAITVLEVGLIKTGLYLWSIASITILDIIAYTGYKYIGIILTVLASLLLGNVAYYIVLGLTGLSMATFMVKLLFTFLILLSDKNISAIIKKRVKTKPATKK